ncbi:MAG: methyl-accepting chemotaxis protein [Thermodesulfovibrionales bacterium]|nr:methyl-accepting chemotaxis protein [Thermodesulfovibrionales bacterium]
MERKAKKTTLFVGLGIVFGITLLFSMATLLALAINIHKSHLKKESELIITEFLSLNDFMITTSNPKNHFAFMADLTKNYSENTKQQYNLSIVSINNSKAINQQEFLSKSLKFFNDNKESPFFDSYEGGTFKYSKPLKMTTFCLKCHTSFKAGDIVGIVSVEIPKAGILPYVEIKDFATYLVATITLIALVFNFIWFKARIIRPLTEIDSVLREVRAGNFNARIPIAHHDEFGSIAETFNTTMDRLTALIQTEEERKEMQRNIIRFLEILSAASEGDLTQRSEVTPDIFGSLADAYNLMVDGLTDLIEKVKISIEDVTGESSKMLSVLKELEDGASSQMVQVKKATDSVNAAATSATEITDKTKIAEQISENANLAITKGSKAVESSIESIQLIRLTIQAINKRMKYLSERLMEIVTISHLINEIANRTNILAINASIEATRAGEQGKGFVVISDEIRSLAEKAAKSTKQITEIINAIQTESALVTKHLEEEIKYVEMGTKTAEDTEKAFKEIEKTIKDTGVIITEISSSAEGQKKLTTDAVTSMQEVQNVSLQVLNLVQEFTSISSSLMETSNRLVSSVERFRLPERDIIVS